MAKKTLKLKKPDAVTSAQPQGAGGGGPVVASVASISGASFTGDSVSYTASGIAGLIAVILLGALLVLQFMENSTYQSVIPQKGVMAMPGQ